MNINLYQTWYDENSYPTSNSELLPFDCRQTPEFYKREVAHLIRLYEEVIKNSEPESYFALLSPKFSDKCQISIKQVKDFISQNPGFDIYLFNPYPMMVYQNLNVWLQGENKHEGLIDLSQFLFDKAELNFNISEKHRNSVENTVYCNYWVASKAFFDDYIPVIKKLDSIIESMPPSDKDKFFACTSYTTHACFYPFIFERVICSFLLMNKQYNVKPYLHDYTSVVFDKKKNVYRRFYKKGLHHYFNDWEKEVDNIDYIETGINMIIDMINPQLPTTSIKPFDKLNESIYKRARIHNFKDDLRKLSKS